jgi:hypothetical protein
VQKILGKGINLDDIPEPSGLALYPPMHCDWSETILLSFDSRGRVVRKMYVPPDRRCGAIAGYIVNDWSLSETWTFLRDNVVPASHR